MATFIHKVILHSGRQTLRMSDKVSLHSEQQDFNFAEFWDGVRLWDI